MDIIMWTASRRHLLHEPRRLLGWRVRSVLAQSKAASDLLDSRILRRELERQRGVLAGFVAAALGEGPDCIEVVPGAVLGILLQQRLEVEVALVHVLGGGGCVAVSRVTLRL